MSNTGIPVRGEGGNTPNQQEGSTKMLFALREVRRNLGKEPYYVTNTVDFVELPPEEREQITLSDEDNGPREYTTVGILRINVPSPKRSCKFRDMAIRLYRSLDTVKSLPRVKLVKENDFFHEKILWLSPIGLLVRVKTPDGRLIEPVKGDTENLPPVLTIIAPTMLLSSPRDAAYEDDPLQEANNGIFHQALEAFLSKLRALKEFKEMGF